MKDQRKHGDYFTPQGGLANRGPGQLKGTFNLMFTPSACHSFKIAGSIYLNVRTNIPQTAIHTISN